MSLIKLHGKYGEGKFALVDEEDFEYLNSFNWNCMKSGYVIRSVYDISTKGSKTIFLHREVVKINDISLLVDHINHNKLDNRKENLRICTPHQNAMNNSSLRNSKSRFKGVRKHKGTKWESQISFCGKTLYIGSYSTEIEAAKAYNEKAIELFGEFACLNEL